MIAAVVVVAVGTGGIWWSRQGSSADPTKYLTATAQRGNVVQTVAATGTVSPQSTLGLSFGGTSAGTGSSASASGSSGSTGSGSASASQSVSSGAATVRTVSVKVGQSVAAGAVLATVDDASQQAALTLAKSQLTAAQTQLTVAQDSLTTANDKGDSTAITQADNSIAQAQNQITQAQNGVTDATNAVTATTLKAPVPGVVTAVNISVGLPPPSGAAVELRSATLVVTADVAEQDVPKLKSGQTGQVTFTALGITGTATLSSLPTQANTSSTGTAVTFPVTLTVKNPPPGLLPGMSASVSITIAQRTNVLTVPTAAIQGTDANATVQVMANNQPQTKAVEIGLSTEQRTEVTVGLSEGDVVITGVVNQTANTGTTGGGFGGGGLTGGGGFGGGGFNGRAGTGGGRGGN
jgi:RND family efflux transporter MFP subunit